MNDITIDLIREKIQKRSPYMHKGSCGRVLICAGAAGMTGAAVLSASAALRTGSGLVYVCTPKNNIQLIQTLVPEAICVDWNDVADILSGKGEWTYDAVAFGPGMGQSPSVRRMLKTLLLSYGGPLIIDADGLNVLAGDADLRSFLWGYSGQAVLTPHVGEARRLLADAEPDAAATREDMVCSLTEHYGTVSIVKGAGTLVARYISEDRIGELDIWRNTTGNPGMATAGSGDVLTGVITSLAGQGLSAWDAARTGVFIHGMAGDLAAEDKGEYGLIARDIAGQVPYAIKNIVNNGEL